jgi:hypothetical protein
VLVDIDIIIYLFPFLIAHLSLSFLVLVLQDCDLAALAFEAGAVAVLCAAVVAASLERRRRTDVPARPARRVRPRRLRRRTRRLGHGGHLWVSAALWPHSPVIPVSLSLPLSLLSLYSYIYIAPVDPPPFLLDALHPHV